MRQPQGTGNYLVDLDSKHVISSIKNKFKNGWDIIEFLKSLSRDGRGHLSSFTRLFKDLLEHMGYVPFNCPDCGKMMRDVEAMVFMTKQFSCYSYYGFCVKCDEPKTGQKFFRRRP